MKRSVRAQLPARSLLDAALLPIEDLAAFTAREASRPRPIYGAHRWFARRFGTAMRALLVASIVPEDGDFWEAFYGEGGDMSDVHLLDPFVGGGTILYEAQRLGAAVTGVDVDPVACAVSRFELSAADSDNGTDPFGELWRSVGKDLAQRYVTMVDGVERIGLHFFWVQQIDCGGCSETFDAHPNHRLGDTHHNTSWTLCPDCGSVQEQPATRKTVACDCGRRARVDSGAVVHGRATCPHCGHEEALIDVAGRTGAPPTWRMVAIESIPADHGRRVPFDDRVFSAPTDSDLDRYRRASEELTEVEHRLPKRLIPAADRSDSRVVKYGYRRYRDLFNDRQLLHLARTAHAVAKLDEDDRIAAGLALSNHTVSNNMLCGYTPRWRQVTPLFTVRSFRHTARPVEINPWVDGPGRGTFPNALRRVATAVAFAKAPSEFTPNGYRPVAAVPAGSARIIHGDSRSLGALKANSVDLVVTDPPYLDNIAYSELADFFVPWLAQVGLASLSDRTTASTLATNDTDVFSAGLSKCFAEVVRVLRPGGRVVFTFQHSSPGAWESLGDALRSARLEVVTVFSMKGDGDRGLHNFEGSSTWDAVFVLRAGRRRRQGRLTAEHVRAVDHHVAIWRDRLNLTKADEAVLRRATLVSATTGFLADPEGTTNGGAPLHDLLAAM